MHKQNEPKGADGTALGTYYCSDCETLFQITSVGDGVDEDDVDCPVCESDDDGDVDEYVTVDNEHVPKQLADFYQHDLSGLFAVRPGSGMDGVILYEDCPSVGGRAAVEIANDDPKINDESHIHPDVSPPEYTFDQLVRKFGLTYEVIRNNTYVYVPRSEQ